MDKKSIISKIREMFTTEEEVNEAFVDVKTDDGRILRVSDMTIGSSIVEITEEGEVALEDGDYVTAEGYTISVEGGVITDIKEPEAEVTEEAPVEAAEGEEKPEEVVEGEDKFIDAVLKDGTKIHIVTQVEGELTPGDIVHVVDEEGNQTEAPAGEHELEDGRILVVGEAGTLVEVKEASEEAPAEEEMEDEQEIKGVLNGLKELINQVKDLKSQFDEVKKENEELKERFNKFASEPSEEPTKQKVDFSKVNKEERLKFFSKK